MTPDESLPTRCQGVERRRHGDGYLLLVADGQILCELNETGIALFDLCDGSTSPSEMTDAICAMFTVSRETVEADVRRTLLALETAGAITWTRAEESNGAIAAE